MTQSSTTRSKTIVVGPGIVGMPMAALLADATRRLDSVPGEVVVIQRYSATSAWKIGAINRGESPIGGIEPDLAKLVATNAAAGTLRASHAYSEAQGADVILICVQTDKRGSAPDYGPLYEALHGIAAALAKSPVRKRPLIIIESTLAPSSMQSVLRPLFAAYGLREGREILLGNSPNRVMPGRLVMRLTNAIKIVGALHPDTARRIAQLYSRIVTHGRLLETNSLTAEVVKTLENAYRDVRIAFAAELVRWCDTNDIDFYALRESVNDRLEATDQASYDGTAVPSGALLVPTVGVGGHCLPKDGVLLWWRALERGMLSEASVILGARIVNDESPAETLKLGSSVGVRLAGKRIAVLGAAYRPDSSDTRNAPSLELALLLRGAGASIVVHDPYVRPQDANLTRLNLTSAFSNSLEAVLSDAEAIFVGTGHGVYRDLPRELAQKAPNARVLVDAANLFRAAEFDAMTLRYAGIGRGRQMPDLELIESVLAQFRAVEQAAANEVGDVCELLNEYYAENADDAIEFEVVQLLARTCATGCNIVDRGPIATLGPESGFVSRLATRAMARWEMRNFPGTLSMRERRRPGAERPFVKTRELGDHLTK
jgi:UDP-N-acetyl-D-mannosaminuronic acid dehydrogenase